MAPGSNACRYGRERRIADHERRMERHELMMQSIDERLGQTSIKVDRIAELIFRDRSSNGHESWRPANWPPYRNRAGPPTVIS